ncbi:MAG: VTT domain-containing protein [Syntrophobacteraceae bacterium]|jgi:uncharacterized membrane protein YdjX (TVP38/TMEM64 family)
MEILSSKSEPGKMTNCVRNKALIKAFLMLVAAGVAIGIVEFTPLKAYLKPEQLQKIISEAGLMGPALLVISCTVGTCLFIPGTVFVGIGAAIFGPGLSFACVWPGALAAAAISFAIARSLGRDFVASLIGDRLKKYDDSIGRNGFKTVLFLRLMFVPFAPMNFGMGLTKVRFRDYFFATALGEAATIFVVTFFIGALRDIWISGDWGRLFSARLVLSLGFLMALVLGANLARSKFERRPAPAVSPSTSSKPV